MPIRAALADSAARFDIFTASAAAMAARLVASAAPAGALNRGTGHVLTGSTQPGVNGLFDMGGNVWEWTSTERNGGFITRGASWWYGPDRQQESDVESKPGDIAVVYIGFRCVADAVKQ